MSDQETKDKEFEDFLAKYTEKLSLGKQSDEEMKEFLEKFSTYMDELQMG